MLRWTMPLVAALVASGTTASAADGTPVVKRGAYRAASQLPPGLPRAHYRYRTTVAPPTYRRDVVVLDEPEVLFTPSSSYVLFPAGGRRAAVAGLLDATRLLRPRLRL
jgi:hypothetical protein